MDNIINIRSQNGQAVTDSRGVAQHFDKQHSHVLRSVDILKKDMSDFGEMFIEENMLIKATCNDGTTYTGKVYKIVIQICENDNSRPHALLFISQDKGYIEHDGEFGCASLWVDKINSLELL